MKFEKTFGNKPVFGMIHTNHAGNKSMLELAKTEIKTYLRYGIYPLIENYFGSTDDCEEVLKWMHSAHPDAIYGVNILGDYPFAFELAGKYGARFIQIDSVCGHLAPERDEEYAEHLSLLRKQYPEITLFGGVRFKYQAVRSGRSVEEDLLLGMERCDAIVCTGTGTGIGTPFEKVEEFKKVLDDFPVIVGAGVTAYIAMETATIADGVIVGSWLKDRHKDIGIVDSTYVYMFMRSWKKGANGSTVKEGDDLYKELMTNDHYKGKDYSWDKTDNGGIQKIQCLVSGDCIQRYLLDHKRKVAYEIMDENQRWVHFCDEDIDWESVKDLSIEALLSARQLSAYPTSCINDYDNGVAIVRWSLFEYSEDYGIWGEQDEISHIYAVVDKDLNVIVKFRSIKYNYQELKNMKAEGIRIISRENSWTSR